MKSTLILVICNQFYSRCSGGCIFHHEIHDSGEENVRSLQYLNTTANWIENFVWICGQTKKKNTLVLGNPGDKKNI